MCGIAGILNLQELHPPDLGQLRKMGAKINHRGGDSFGIYRDNNIGLVCSRLAIIDLLGGKQPFCNEDGSIWGLLNGEIFNYKDIAQSLKNKGHVFFSNSDSEVLVHLFEEEREAMFDHLNGQFSFVIWDSTEKQLLLARDQFGIHPLFYTIRNGLFIFASEIKSIFTHSEIPRAIDLYGIDQVFTFWTCIGQRTAFEGIRSVLPGNYLLVSKFGIASKKYWEFPFLHTPESTFSESIIQTHAQSFLDVLDNSVQGRLNSDVPLGIYLSGGIDSSTIAFLAKSSSSAIKTFSIAFDDQYCDESHYQKLMVEHLRSEHYVLNCSSKKIGEIFPEVIWHAETPLVRTAAAPLFLLSELVHDLGVKVVLAGEGADELLLGYDIYKAVVFKHLLDEGKIDYSELENFKRILRTDPYYHQSYINRIDTDPIALYSLLSTVAEPFGLHQVRWNNMAKSKFYYSADMKRLLKKRDRSGELLSYLPENFPELNSMERAQLLDLEILLSRYLLSSQGDRMSMAHAVEVRYPFLDTNIVKFLANMPTSIKLKADTEKYLLREATRGFIPEEINTRTKQAYTAPPFLAYNGQIPEYIDVALGQKAIEDAGYFDPGKVKTLRTKYESRGQDASYYYSSYIAVLSVQLLHELFVSHGIEPNIELRENTLVDKATY